MKLAVISDVHGNLPALEAVLADIHAQGVQQTVNLGILFRGRFFQLKPQNRLIPLNMPTIRGNHERQLLEQDMSVMSLSDRHAAERLTAAHWQWLNSLPTELNLHDEILMVHGVPGDDLVYLLEEVKDAGVRPSSEVRVLSLIGDRNASLILCGHTHIPRKMQLADGRLIVNPGSVGLQAYDDDKPRPHVMESGSPQARYAIVERREGDWHVDFRAVDYDWTSAASVARRHHRPDWINALVKGRM